MSALDNVLDQRNEISTDESARAELAALRQRIAELEAQAANDYWHKQYDQLAAAIAELHEWQPLEESSILKQRQCCAKCDARAEAVREAAAHAKTDQDTGSVAGWKDMSSQERRMWRMGYVCGTQDMHDSIRAMPIPPCDCNPLAPEA